MVLHACFPSLCGVFSCSYTEMRRSLHHASSVTRPTSTRHVFSRRALPLILRLRLRFLANNALTLNILAHPLIVTLSRGHDDATTCMPALTLKCSLDRITDLVQDFNGVARFKVA